MARRVITAQVQVFGRRGAGRGGGRSGGGTGTATGGAVGVRIGLLQTCARSLCDEA